MFNRLWILALLLSVSAAPRFAAAQGYPQRPIKLIVAIGSGSSTDAIARILAEKLSPLLNVPVVVENREGGGGVIGTTAAAKSAPDGYTLLLGIPSMTVASHVQVPRPYDAVQDFVPIVKVAELPLVLITSTEAPYKSFKELIAYARANPGKISYATSGKGTPSHLGVELIRQFTRVTMVDIPYKNIGQAMTDTISGQVSLYFPGVSAAMGQVRAGKVRALALGAAKRIPQLPDVPTVAEELGATNLDVITWYGLLAPAGTPKDIVARLHSETAKVMEMPDVRERMAKGGFFVSVAGPEEFTAQVKADDAKYHKLVIDLGLKQ